MKHIIRLISCLLAVVPLGGQAASEADPSVTIGAQTYLQRCALCHGSFGMGEGPLPLALKNYPRTNLLDPRYPTDEASLRQQIIWGGSKGDMNPLSPPWGNELTWTQMESTIQFIQQLRADTGQSVALLKRLNAEQTPVDIETGRNIYQGRCAICHGKTGKGDGRMAKIIKNPPPFNLTLSRAPDSYLHEFISKGGEAMGRSYRMPPWGEELSKPELESVIGYIKTLRK